MLTRRFVFVLLLGISSPLILSAQTSGEAWKKLENAMKREIETLQGDEVKNAKRERQQAEAARVHALATTPGDNGQIEMMLVQTAGVFQSDAVAHGIDDVRLAIRHERQAKDAALAAQTGEFIKRGRELTRSAKEPSDLDSILKDLTEFQGARGSRQSEEAQAAIYKAQAVRQFLEHWQDYLAQIKTGDTKRAADTLRNIANNSSTGVEFLPRSEVVAMIEKASDSSDTKGFALPDEELPRIVAKAKTLADLAGVMKELRELRARREGVRSNYGGLERVVAAINTLGPIEKTYREFQAGLPTNLNAEGYSYEAAAINVVPLRKELLLLLLPRYLGLTPENSLQPGETLEAFLDRIIKLARERTDVALLVRAQDAKRTLSRGNYVWNNAGLLAFTAARNQEAAGQILLAIISYQNVLSSGTDDIPAKFVGEKLEALKAAHPREYAQAIEQFLYQSGAGARPDRYPETEPEPNLTVPGATAQPSPSPAATRAKS